MTRILGIDPGSRTTGFGIVEFDHTSLRHISSGIIQVGQLNMPERLSEIFKSITDLINDFAVDRGAIETSFVADNPQVALKLGQARGAAIAAVARQNVAIHEYAPREIKRAIVGTGKANKQQVQFMVRTLLSLAEMPKPDAADALAVAICDISTRRFRDVVDSGQHEEGVQTS